MTDGDGVWKVDELWDGEAWQVERDLRFVYDGWNLLLELDGLESNDLLRKYTWCLDMSGSLHGAGGISG